MRIKVEAIGINRAEAMWRVDDYIEPVKFPAGLGYEAAGTVDAVGKDVSGFAVGDEVDVIPSFSMNEYATYGEVILVPDHAVVRQPKSLSFTEAASVWMMFVSSGEVPTSFPEMGANAIAFIKALGLSKVDVLGFSIGGMVAQEIAFQAPDLVRRLVLVGTGPRGVDMSASRSAEIFAGTYDPPEHLWLAVHFSPSEAGRIAGLAFLQRKLQRQDRDAEVSERAATRQREAISKYIASSDGVLDYLKGIRQPTLVVQGSNDVIIPTMNSYVLQQQLPNAQLIVYPDSNHGSFYQYPELFLKHATLFLDA